MPSLFEIQTVTRQFFRVETELSVLKAMVRDLLTPPVDPANFAPNAPLTVEQPPYQRPTYPPTALFYNGVKVEQPPTEAPEPRQAQHFDGKRWVPGPSPEPSDADKPVGQG